MELSRSIVCRIPQPVLLFIDADYLPLTRRVPLRSFIIKPMEKNALFQKFIFQTSRSPKNKPQEVPKTNLKKSRQ
jgi:hypothetical protein